jgi:putative NADH-flavin reductase
VKTIAVFGASGRTGRPFTELALKEGYQVKASMRDPSKLEFQHPNLQVLQGDLADQAKFEETVRGTEAVLHLVGLAPNSPGPNDTRTITARHIIAAMQKHNVKRIIRLASVIGARDKGDKPTFGKRLILSIGKMMMRKAVDDEVKGANLIQQSNLDWTFVREFYIRLETPKGSYRVGNFGAPGNNDVTSGDLAAFILEELKNGKYIRQLPFVRN